MDELSSSLFTEDPISWEKIPPCHSGLTPGSLYRDSVAGRCSAPEAQPEPIATLPSELPSATLASRIACRGGHSPINCCLDRSYASRSSDDGVVMYDW